MNRRTASATIPTIVGALILAVIASVATTLLMPASSKVAGGNTQSDFERIVQSGKIRCGYVSNPPSCIIDPNTGEVSGIFVDVLNEIATSAELEIEWTEEVGFGSMIEGLLASRYDIVPCAIWPSAARAKEADFSEALFYSGVCAYVRKGDTRFTNNLQLINSPDVKIATMDGEMAEAIADTDFPKAQRVEVPQLSEISTMLLNVAQGKADVTFVETFFAYEYLQNNPDSVENITPDAPLRVFPNTVLLGNSQPDLRSFLNVALEQQLNLGTVDRMIDKYEPAPGIFFRRRVPFRTSAEHP